MSKNILVFAIILLSIFNILKEEKIKDSETKLKWCKISSNYFYGNTNNCNDLENKVNTKIQYLKQ